jgi:ring-1,2-phenylacetyl-CoA epoxidase subunit PaaE
MATATQEAPSLNITRIPDPAEPVPTIAWPTVALLIFGIAVWGGSAAAALADVWPWWVSTLISAVASYLLFTVAHDASHHAASSDRRLNTLMGRIATPLFAPHAAFPVWRFIHMQHHRFTNHHDDGRDPDGYTMRGPAWQRPFRWLTIDLYYMVFYLPKLKSRPRPEKIEMAVQLVLVAGATAAAIVAGYGFEILVLYYLPCRLAILFLAFAFDWLPHNGLHHKPSEDKLKTTRNRVGYERLLSPALLYQNYHLVHHLHPIVPFYRYLKVWRRNEDQYLAGDPALSTVGGRPLTADEYRQLRELAHHH